MVKKIRFPLIMENGIEVRSIEELRDNFSISKIIFYLREGKLIVWLRDRYANDIADLIEELDLQDEKIPQKISEIFDVPYDKDSEEKMEKAIKRAERISKLKKYNDDKKYEEVVDNIAFDQDELYDLLDEDVDVIYLCGERFSIPLSKPGVTYIGVNSPIGVIDSKVKVDWDKIKISLENIEFDKKYQSVLDSLREVEEVLQKINDKKYQSGLDSLLEVGEVVQKIAESLKKTDGKLENNDNIKQSIEKYNKSYISFMIPKAKKKQAEDLFHIAKGRIREINYNIENKLDTEDLKEMVIKNNIIGLGNSFIDRMEII